MEMHEYSLSCRFKNCEDNLVFVFARVYGLVVGSYREVLREELGTIRGLWEDPWSIGSDFNVTIYLVQRSTSSWMIATTERCLKVIEEMELRDLPLQGEFFTWRGGKIPQIRQDWTDS